MENAKIYLSSKLSQIVKDIPTLRILSGPALSTKEQNLINQNIDILCDEYYRVNPKRHKRK